VFRVMLMYISPSQADTDGPQPKQDRGPRLRE
jgi:hypothetical protein